MSYEVMEIASPNRDDRPEDAAITMLVLHYTGMQSGREAIARLCDRNAQVSAHYVVEEDGTIYRLVDEADRAWHAGKSFWRGRERVNDVSIGVEIVNPGHEFGYRVFPEAQMQAVVWLAKDIVTRHGIRPRNVVGHSDVAPDRKEDPGELFDWARLAEAGVGKWPVVAATDVCPLLRCGDEGEAVLAVQRRLNDYGYAVTLNGVFDEAFQKVVIAFQRHFRQRDIAGQWDGECDALLGVLSH